MSCGSNRDLGMVQCWWIFGRHVWKRQLFGCLSICWFSRFLIVVCCCSPALWKMEGSGELKQVSFMSANWRNHHWYLTCGFETKTSVIVGKNYMIIVFSVNQLPDFAILNWIKWMLTFDEFMNMLIWLKFILIGPPCLFQLVHMLTTHPTSGVGIEHRQEHFTMNYIYDTDQSIPCQNIILVTLLELVICWVHSTATNTW